MLRGAADFNSKKRKKAVDNAIRSRHRFSFDVAALLLLDQGLSMIPLFAIALTSITWLNAADLELFSPTEYQVVQRTTRERGSIPISGRVRKAAGQDVEIEARIIANDQESKWQKTSPTFDGDDFKTALDAPAGGWYRLDLRVIVNGKVLAESTVAQVGVGEVFVVAGQSNSANHGEAKQTPSTRRVVNFDGKRWQLANDPQPGASGSGGSFIPAFGDAIATRFDVPVGIIACGIGATSVREWLPTGNSFPNPPTIESRVQRKSDGTWESKGEAFSNLVTRIRPLGKSGFRAVLWHQGESDANQQDTNRTLPGPLYHEYLTTVIQSSRREIDWDAPWFVAQVSYHTPGDEASPDIREAQAALWRKRPGEPGPDQGKTN